MSIVPGGSRDGSIVLEVKFGGAVHRGNQIYFLYFILGVRRY